MKRIFKPAPLISIVITIFILFQTGCAVNPVTGKKEIMLISENMEIEMGQEIDRGLRMEYGLYGDPQLRDYISRIGHDMAPHTHRPHLEYHFAVLDTSVENAFAAPGGYIYITRGLLALMNSEAELATVIGHELGHVNARHSARQMTRSILFTVGIFLASELSEDFRKIAPISWIAGQLLFLKYSRSDEYQADALGVEYALKVNYSAGEMVTFFNSLQRLTASEGGGMRLPNFLSTHPMTPRRIERIKEMLQSEEYRRSPGMPRLAVNRNGYMQKIDGLVYGDNPRHGYVEGNAFYHPDMRFYFHIPNGWQCSNTPRQVSLAPKNGKAAIILKAEESTEPLDSYSQKMMKNLSNPKVLRQEFTYINGLNAHYSLVQLPGDGEESEEKNGGQMNADITCIRKGGIVFTFFSAASSSDFAAYRRIINRTVNSFDRLTDSRHLKRRPKRVFVETARRRVSLQDFLSRKRIDKKDWQKIALINSLELNSQLTPNQLIKVIR